MLDLISMTMAIGAQTELESVRKQTGVDSALTSQPEAVEQPTLVSQASQLVESGLQVVENAVSTAASALTPDYEMFTGFEMDVGASSSSSGKKKICANHERGTSKGPPTKKKGQKQSSA